MCVFKAPKIPTPPPPAQFQAVQAPREQLRDNRRNMARRRGLWSQIMTSPQGITTAPTVTGTSGGKLG